MKTNNMTRGECEDYIRTHRITRTKSEAHRLKAVDRRLNRLSCND